MEKPIAPSPAAYGTSDAEVKATFDFSVDHAIPYFCLSLVALYELYSALSLSPSDWEAHPIGYLFAGVLLAFPALVFSIPVAAILSGLANAIVPHLWPRYARVNRFRVALKKYQSALTEFELWQRRQKEAWWRSLSGVAFEGELGRLFTMMGYQVASTPRTADGGVDLVLEREGQKTVVQCKAHASKVGIATARELVASMVDFRAQRGILAVTSGVTKPVREYVRDKNIQVLDLAEIVYLQRKHDA